jgi:hypothetical protein
MHLSVIWFADEKSHGVCCPLDLYKISKTIKIKYQIYFLSLYFLYTLFPVYGKYTYIVGKYKIYLYELQKLEEKRTTGKLFWPVLQRVQITFMFTDNVLLECQKAQDNCQII